MLSNWNNRPIKFKGTGGILNQVANVVTLKPFTKRMIDSILREVYYPLESETDWEMLTTRLRLSGVKGSIYLPDIDLTEFASHKTQVSQFNFFEKHGNWKLFVYWNKDINVLQVKKGTETMLETDNLFEVGLFVSVKSIFEKAIKELKEEVYDTR